MAIVYNNHDCYLIDHREYMKEIYKNVAQDDKIEVSYTITAKLFSVFDMKTLNNRKRGICDNFHEDTIIVKEMYERVFKQLPVLYKENFLSNYKLLNTSDVRDFAKEICEATTLNLRDCFGGNNSNLPLKCSIKGNDILLPPNSRFYCGSVHEQCEKIKGDKFEIVIADPPWWNKYIRRLKTANDMLSYSMMYNEDIASIPIKELLSENCLIAVWCTNAPSNVAAVKNLIFPKWGVQYVATWYWLKVTVELKPVCNFASGSKKQPYERIIIGKVGDIKDLPDTQLCISVPSALHSHKPPLLDMLTPFVKTENPQILELFARYLLPNTTSIGYEPLKWQHMKLFEEIT